MHKKSLKENRRPKRHEIHRKQKATKEQTKPKGRREEIIKSRGNKCSRKQRNNRESQQNQKLAI
jgi:hypothetical protein